MNCTSRLQSSLYRDWVCRFWIKLTMLLCRTVRPPRKSRPFIKPAATAAVREITMPSPTARTAPMHHRSPAPPHPFDFRFPNLSLSSDDEESEPETGPLSSLKFSDFVLIVVNLMQKMNSLSLIWSKSTWGQVQMQNILLQRGISVRHQIVIILDTFRRVSKGMGRYLCLHLVSFDIQYTLLNRFGLIQSFMMSWWPKGLSRTRLFHSLHIILSPPNAQVLYNHIFQ